MTKFLTEHDLNIELAKLISTAKQKIILISPVIKLHKQFVPILEKKSADHKFRITIVFGRQEEDISKSMSAEDFAFFKQLKNIEIRHEKWLHANYYANESSAILSTMNLYDHSHDHHLETGIFLNRSLFRAGLNANLGDDAWKYFESVAGGAKVVFRKSPTFKRVYLGLSKRYVDSTVELDELSNAFESKRPNGKIPTKDAVLPGIAI